MSPASSVIHIENSYASGQKKRPRGPRATQLVQPIGVPSNPNNVLSIERSLDDLKSQAIAYYMYYHLQTFPDALNISRSVADGLIPVWTSRVDCPILDLAVSSMALAVVSRTQQIPAAAVEASRQYEQLLRITQKTILSLDEASIDTVLK
ncbi:hypothetical protein LSUE1_G002268 [Lachnellula suecica]|uniref:Uncharacterized protein n=1 Tax=Lachnellula suecica TaxID=602035 RepID=A0A8T9CBA0_9HELO|nr:hypothetical protein LSUE1_G002268 [Lachnellula suecica]